MARVPPLPATPPSPSPALPAAAPALEDPGPGMGVSTTMESSPSRWGAKPLPDGGGGRSMSCVAAACRPAAGLRSSDRACGVHGNHQRGAQQGPMRDGLQALHML